MFFILTAIQYWTSDYLESVLQVDTGTIFYLLAASSITGPILGIILGGCLVQSLGGYEKKQSFLAISVLSFFGLASGAPLPFLNQPAVFLVFWWFFLFFGGTIAPTLYGILVSSVRPELRGIGNSVSNFFTHFLGFIQGPYVYGLIYESTKDQHPSLAYGVVIYYSLLSFFFIICATVTKYWQSAKEEAPVNKGREQEIDSSMKYLDLAIQPQDKLETYRLSDSVEQDESKRN